MNFTQYFPFFSFRKILSTSIKKINDIDIYAKEFHDNFYSQYEKFHASDDKILFIEKSNCYLVYKYDAVQAILNNHSEFPSTHLSSVDSILLGNNGTKHSKNKKIVFHNITSLGRENVYNAKEFSDKCCDTLIRRTETKSAINLIDEVVNPYTFTIILNELGFKNIPVEWNIFNEAVSTEKNTDEIKKIFADWNLLINVIKENLSEGSLSHSLIKFIHSINEGNSYTKDELIKFIRLFILAGAETTASLIASVIFILAAEPHHITEIKKDKKYLDRFLNELLRFYSPAQFTFRNTEREISFFNKIIPANSVVAVAIGAANRDPDIFKNPNTFNLNRQEKHIAFGIGRHKCVGEHLSVFIAKSFLEKFLPVIEQMEFIPPFNYYNTLFTFKVSTVNVKRK